MKKWLIEKEGKLHGPVFTSGFTPLEGKAYEWPEGAEDVRDVRLIEVQEMGVERIIAVTDEVRKEARIAADSAAQAEAEAKAQLQSRINRQQRRRELGLQTIDLIGDINNQKGLSLDAAAFLQGVEFQSIYQMLSSGFVESALETIRVTNVSAIFTTQEKQEVIDFLEIGILTL